MTPLAILARFLSFPGKILERFRERRLHLRLNSLAKAMDRGDLPGFLSILPRRFRGEVLRGAKDIESRKPSLPRWEPSARHLADSSSPSEPIARSDRAS